MSDLIGWGGRVDRHDGDAGLRWHQIVTSFDPDFDQGAVFLGLASDDGVRRNQGRVGAAAGPPTLRRMMSNLPVHSPMFLQDAGDVVCLAGELESAQFRYAQIGSQVLVSGRRLIGLGGGHEIGFASYSALAQSGVVKPNERVGILNLDSHFDLRREPQATSGTPFLQAMEDSSRHWFQLEYRVMGISRAA
ncbi:arginase family protein, partial [Armatimonas sp.]|uniref:arginase family protein n=1 Tax=Armatimonas sp. TaxID=1872638 RepID=UPI00286B1D6A